MLVLVEQSVAAVAGEGDDELVFGRADGGAFTPTHVRNKALKAWAAVGHSSTYMTDRYRHLLEGQAATDAARLHEYVNGGTGAQTGAQGEESA